jgi:outer membrane protein assembly factor BamB
MLMIRLLPLLLAASVLLIGPAPTSAQKQSDWLQFRGPGGQGISADKGVPVTWGPNSNIVWKAPLPGPGTSAPVILGDKVFLTCYSGFIPSRRQGNMDQLRLHVLCLARATGKQLWAKELEPRLPEQQEIREGHGYATPTPVTDGTSLFVFFGKSGVFAFDLNGKQLWHTTVGDGLNGWGCGTSPVLHGDHVIINASVESQSLIALNKKTGKEVWRGRGIQESWNTPILAKAPGGKTEIVLAMNDRVGQVLGFDPANGTKLWSCKTDITWYKVPSLVTEDTVVYCTGGRGSGGSLAVKTGGRGDVTATHRLWKENRGTNVPSPILYQGHLYLASDAAENLYCLNARTGKVVFEERLERSGGVYASLLLADGKLYIVGRMGKTFVVEAKPEFNLVAANDPLERGTFNATPAIAGGKLFLRSDTALYCIGSR